MIIICRLALFNKKGIELIEREYGLEKFLKYLEKNCGGHGNGILAIKNGRIAHSAKGLSLSCKKIAENILNHKEDDYVLFHTRIASAGSVKNENCHPYIDEDYTFALMMNGTEKNFSNMARSIDITDTELVFRTMVDNDLPLKALHGLTANYLGFKDEKVFAVSNSSYNPLEFIEEDGAVIIASVFPVELDRKFKSKGMGSVLWVEGEELKGWKTHYADIKDSTGVPIVPKTAPGAMVVEIGGKGKTRIVEDGWHKIKSFFTDDDVEVCRRSSTIWDDVDSGYENDLKRGLLGDGIDKSSK